MWNHILHFAWDDQFEYLNDWLSDWRVSQFFSATNADNDQLETTSAKAQAAAGAAAKRGQKAQSKKAKSKAEESKIGPDSLAVNNEGQNINEK